MDSWLWWGETQNKLWCAQGQRWLLVGTSWWEKCRWSTTTSRGTKRALGGRWCQVWVPGPLDKPQWGCNQGWTGTDGQSEVTEESPSAGERVADSMRDITECGDERRTEMDWRIKLHVCQQIWPTDWTQWMRSEWQLQIETLGNKI